MRINKRAAVRIKALLLILLAIFFAEKFVSGTLYYYIGPRFGWLAIVAVMLLILIGGSYSLPSGSTGDEHDDHPHHNHGHGHDHGDQVSAWPILLVALPLVLGVSVPASPLGSSAVDVRGVSTEFSTTASSGERTLTIVPGERNVLDWVEAINEADDPAEIAGEPADVIGFVYRDPRFADNQFMLARFTITCCVADAMAIGIVIEDPAAAEYAADTWVRVEGEFAEGAVDGNTMPVLVAEAITPIEPPEQPYLYP
jgi:putative membrane protein